MIRRCMINTVSRRCWLICLQLTVEQGLITDLNLLNFGLAVSHSDTTATISDWNSLPFGIVEAETTDSFKLKYHSYQASQPEASAWYPFQGSAN